MQKGFRFSWALACLLAILLLTAAVRIRLVDVPLERDEGEYAYAGQLILQGAPPYRHVYNMKMPGIYAGYALLEAAFGETHRAHSSGPPRCECGHHPARIPARQPLVRTRGRSRGGGDLCLPLPGPTRSGGLRKRGTLRSPPCSRRNPAVDSIRESPGSVAHPGRGRAVGDRLPDETARRGLHCLCGVVPAAFRTPGPAVSMEALLGKVPSCSSSVCSCPSG